MKQLLRHGIAGAVAAMVIAAGATQAQAVELKLTAGASHPPFVPWVGVLKDFVVPQSVARAKELGHTISWTEAYAGALFDFNTAAEGVGDGLADLAWIGTLWEPNKMPLTNVTFFAPFGTGDTAILREIQEELHATIPGITEEWRRNNLQYLGAQVIDGYVVISKKPVSALSDLKGRKLMTPGAVARWAAGTGAVGVNGGLPIYYNNMKTGVAEGSLVPGTGILPFKLHEVAPYVTQANLGGCICGGLTMNADTWDALPDELQVMFRELGVEYGKRVAAAIKNNREEHVAVIQKQGATVSTLDLAEQRKWAQNMPNIAKEWADGLEKRGRPARAALKAYMEGQRKRNAIILRDWDKEL